MQEYLNKIKLEIKRKIKLEPHKEEITDLKILTILNNDKNINLKDKECYYITLYSAIYFDNLSMLDYLKNNNISLGIYPSNLSIYLLDKNFTKYFTKCTYLNFIKRYKLYLNSFFLSIKDYDNKDYYIKRFIHLSIRLNDKLDALEHLHPFLGSSLFSKTALDTFDDETYFKASITQLNRIIAPLEKVPSNANKKRLNNLIKNTSFSLFAHNYDLLLELFSDEELLKIDVSPEYFFTKALHNNIDLTRVLSIYKHYPNIINSIGCLTKEIFNNYSNEEIIYLSKIINFNSTNLNNQLNSYNLKRKVISLLPFKQK